MNEDAQDSTGKILDALERSYKNAATLREQVASLTAERDKMREGLVAANVALAPFAFLAQEIEECAAKYADAASRDPENWAKSCAWADLRAARDCLAKVREAMGIATGNERCSG